MFVRVCTFIVKEVLNMSFSTECEMEKQNVRSFKGLLTELKFLTKGKVLIANVFPIVATFFIALSFSSVTFLEVWDSFIYMIIGSTLVVAGALIFNNWYEVDLDVKMERTQQRPTVTGNLSMSTVLMLGILATIIGHAILFFTSLEAFAYAFIGWFTYVVLYTFWTKRRYTLNTVIGSLSGAVTPLIGWAVIDPAYHIVPIVLFVLLFLWQIPHTFAIAMRRHDDYKAANVPMLPVVYGFDMTKRQNAVYIACLLPLPFLLISLGKTFVVITTILNVIWLIYSIRGVFRKDDEKYANTMFVYSLAYLGIVFGMMMVIPIFA